MLRLIQFGDELPHTHEHQPHGRASHTHAHSNVGGKPGGPAAAEVSRFSWRVLVICGILTILIIEFSQMLFLNDTFITATASLAATEASTTSTSSNANTTAWSASRISTAESTTTTTTTTGGLQDTTKPSRDLMIPLFPKDTTDPPVLAPSPSLPLSFKAPQEQHQSQETPVQSQQEQQQQIEPASGSLPPPPAATQQRSESLPASTTNQPDDEPPIRKQQEPRVVMVTYVFGKAAAEKKYLRMFVEAARYTGIDILIVGDYAPPCFSENDANLPNNVRHLLISWNELIDRVDRNVLQQFTNESSSAIASSLQALRQTTNYYKIIDYKPLFAVLFPEQVAAYDWWGHVDNDMILGDIRFFLSSNPRVGDGYRFDDSPKGGGSGGDDSLLNNFDIIVGNRYEFTWGPFTLYRNTPQINELFRYAERPLVDIFASPDPQVFDEWGGGFNRKQGQHYESTMSGIIEKHHRRLKIRWYGKVPAVWDGFCRGHKADKGFCTECHLHRFKLESSSSNNQTNQDDSPQQQQASTFVRQHLEQNCYGQRPCRPHVALCHFEFSKETMEESMNRSIAANDGNDDAKYNSDAFPIISYLRHTGGLRVNFLEGFTTFNSSSSAAAAA